MIRSLLVVMVVAWAALVAAAGGQDGSAGAAPQAPAPAPADGGAPAPAALSSPPQAPSLQGAPKRFYVIQVDGAISKPTLFIIRRGVKEAIAAGAEMVILDMDTPGGGLGETLQIMEILDRFGDTTSGRVITFVRNEAGSAGAIIAAVTDEIYFAPKSVIGAAEVVLASGEDVGDSMKRKITSFLAAKVRAFSEENPMRGEVLRAMMDPTFELKIGDEVIKPKDVLLTLTATEATREYGDPPRPLFGSGIVADLPALYQRLAAGSAYEVRAFEMTWSIQLARWLTAISPLLLAVGGILLYIEFKTPGFGVFGVSGIILLLIVFFGHHLAGLSGHEPILVFLLGVVLVFVELLFMPGAVIPAVLGLMLMFGSLIWGMADLWPKQPLSWDAGVFVRPMANLGIAAILGVVGVAALMRFLPRGWFFQRLAIAEPVAGTAQVAGLTPEVAAELSGLIGREGIAVTDLFPSGHVEVDGRRYEARVEVGMIERGQRVLVRGRGDFGLIVEAVPS